MLRLKIADTAENFKTISGSSSNYDQSNHTTYGQTETVATVSLNYPVLNCII
jgi:hypothetical protein